MFCSHCGANLPDDPEYCPNCGTKIGASFAETAKTSFQKIEKDLGSVVDGAVSGIADGLTEAANDIFKNKKTEKTTAQTADFADRSEDVVYMDIPSENTDKRANSSNYGGNNSYFDGSGGELFVKELLLLLVSVITLGIATPWVLVKVTEWKKSHTVINGKRLQFNGNGSQLFGLWIKWWLLSIITCGIYSFFAMVDYFKWEAKHTSYEGDFEVDGIYADSYFDGNSFEWLGYSLLTGFVTSITCSLALPWMDCIIHSWKKKSTVVSGDRLCFDGTGSQLFGTYIVVALLTLVTCGIYSAWGECRIEQFICSHTYVEKTSVRG